MKPVISCASYAKPSCIASSMLLKKAREKYPNLRFSKSYYSTTPTICMDPIFTSIALLKSKAATETVSSCSTSTATYPDINFWSYISSSINGAIMDLIVCDRGGMMVVFLI